MPIPHIPVIRRGQSYESLEKAELKSVRTGEPIAAISQANAGLLRRDLRRVSESRQALAALAVERLLEICARAGDLFMTADLPLGEGTQSAEEYVQALSHTSGLPHALVRRNMAKIHQVFTQMPTILRGLTRGMDHRVIDEGFGEQAGVPVSYFAVTDALGVVLPSNSPGVNSLWMPAVALKIPVVLKPGREEPWTPYRIIQAFIAAGCPAEAFSFYPTDHEGSAAVMESCGRALIFGDEGTVEKYAANPGVQVHGPGRSKILIGADMADRWPEFIGLMADSIAENGGRSCINASAVLVPSHGREIAAALAERLAAIRPRPADDERATLAGFANPKMAEFIEAAISQGLDVPGVEDVTAKHRSGGRVETLDGSTYLLPTLVRCETFDHPLANREFLFPYASVVEMPQEQMLEVMGPSLVATALTRDEDWIERLIASPLIDRLNIGPLPTTRVQWDQPHEGNLFEFLYRRRAIQRAQG
jgi:acyl-CoA reductase-like NAD-dependent aldehyde dehydrogenase